MHFPSHPRSWLLASSRLLLTLFAGVAIASHARSESDATPVTAQPPTGDVAAAPVSTPAAVPPSDAKTNAIENAVVKVFSTIRRPDAYRPWTKAAPSEVSGSGVIIEDKRILTNAHVVMYASQVQIQANQAGDKISATVEAIAPGIDLAVLKLDDESFFDTHPPIARANTLPEIKDAVLAYGYPTGGTSLSITKGIVSRIEFAGYNYSTSGLRIQIDAAINPGNSGGPAIAGDKMIGLAFSHLGGAQNIGYIIPTEEINLFLADIADGKYDGKPAMFDDLQTLENPALRAYLGLNSTVKGIIVHKPYRDEPTYPLRSWDVVTKIGDAPIDDQGMIKVGTNLRIRFQYLIQQIAKGGKVPLTLVRSGKELTVELPVTADRPFVIPSLKGAYPSYFVFGPMVFSTATAEFCEGIEGNAGALRFLTLFASPLVTRRGDMPAFPGENLVVVSSPFFPHKLAKGYGVPAARVVETINGTHVNNLAHLVELLRDSKDDFIRIEFGGRDAEAIVLPRKDCIAATDDILTDNGVRAQGSADTLAVWNVKPPAAAAATAAAPATKK
jgi:S1-C subfamily serine protease